MTATSTAPERARHAGRDSPPSFWQIAHSLDAMSESQRLDSIKQGFSVSSAEAVRVAFGLSASDFGLLLNLSASTFERRKKDDKPLNAVASERLDRLAAVAILAEEVFVD
jgi:uncharacterized protein (DUF2384 family)